MTALREAAQQMLEVADANQYAVANQAPHGDVMAYNAAVNNLRTALKQEEEASAWLAERKEHWRKEREKAQATKDQDPELSAALGWPGGISDPVLDRTRLLQIVAALRLASKQALEALEDARTFTGAWPTGSKAITALRAALAQQDEPVQETGFWGRVAARQASRIKQLETAVQQALEVLQFCTPKPRPTDDDYAEQGWKEHYAAMTALRAALAQQDEPAREWVSMDEYKRLQGLVTSQGIRLMEYESKQPQQAEPRNQCRSDGRCQYAIDHGAEGMGHCPKGKCVMAQHTQPAEDRDVAQSNLRVMKEMFREQTEPAQQAEPTLTVERLRDALVASRIIPPAAVEDPDEYDDGVTLHRIEALHRRIA